MSEVPESPFHSQPDAGSGQKGNLCHLLLYKRIIFMFHPSDLIKTDISFM